MKRRLFQVDAFTNQVFRGNPAGVCLLDSAVSDRWLQALASEMNLSETAFVWPVGDRFRLRWFTPTVEVDLCGHATLAAAHVLWETEELDGRLPARFDTRSGPIQARRCQGWIEMDFPAVEADKADPPPHLLEALGIQPVFVGQSRFDYLVEVANEQQVRQMTVDLHRLKNVAARGVIVTAVSDNVAYDFVSRFFAPAVGVDEDPVTGSAHCTLGPYWARRLDKTELTGYQASSRGGVVKVRPKNDRVWLMGQAVTVMEIQLSPTAQPEVVEEPGP